MTKLYSIFLHLPLISLCSVTCLLPLVFTTNTTDYYELPKTLVLIAFLAVFIFSFFILSLGSGGLKVTLGPITYPLLAFLFWTSQTFFFSRSHSDSYSGWLTNFPGTLLSVLLLCLFFFTLTSLMRKISTIKKVFLYFYLSTFLVSLLGILQAFNRFLFPQEVTHNSFWTPAGINTELTGMIVVLGYITGFYLLWQTLNGKKNLVVIWLSLSLLVVFSYLALLNLAVLWLMLLLGVGIFLLLTKGFDTQKSFLLFFTVLASLFIFTLRLLFFSNLALPQQVSLPLSEKIHLTLSNFTHHPLLGTGPATFSLNFRQYKSVEFNQTPLSSINFTTSGSWAVDQVASIGIVGFLLYLTLFVITLVYLGRFYAATKKGETTHSLSTFLIALVIVLLVSSFLLPTNLALYFFTFLVISLSWALLKVSQPTSFREIKFKGADFGWLITLGTVVLLSLSLNLSWKILTSDLLRRQADRIAPTSPETSYTLLLGAIRINKSADFLHRQFALTNLALADSVAKNPTLNEEEKVKTATILVKQVLNEAKAATTVSPNDSRNWKLYGSVLLQLNNSLPESEISIEDKFEKALALEPTDPDLYVSLAELATRKKNYQEAIGILEKGIQMKANYYPLRQKLAESYLLQAETRAEAKLDYYQKAEAEFKKTLALMDKNNPNFLVIEQKLSQVQETLR